VGELQAARAPSSVAISIRERREVGVIAHLGIGKGHNMFADVRMIAVVRWGAFGRTEARGGETEGGLWSTAWSVTRCARTREGGSWRVWGDKC
jgi:hypothetical protein